MSDTTGDKIIKAREDERRRITKAHPLLTTKMGFDGFAGQHLPTLEIRIVGGDPDALTALGLTLQRQVLDAMPNLIAAEAGDER
jgi:hypothetical protein